MSDNKSTRLLRLVDELAEAAQRLGLEVRREKILAEQAATLAEALRSHDLEALYLSPAARCLVDANSEPR
jgi:hypothetical protein